MQSPAPGQQQQQQMIVTPDNQPQPTTQWVVAAPRPTTVPNYKHRQSIFLGVTLIVAGALSIVFNIIDLAVWSDTMSSRSYYGVFSLGFVGHGIWSGCMCVIAGGFGVGAGSKKTSCLVRSFLVLCIIAAVFCLAQFSVAVASAAISGSQYNTNNFYYGLCCSDNCGDQPRSPTGVCQEVQTLIAMESLLAILAFIGGVAAIWGSALGCLAACCCCCADQNSQQFAIVQGNETQIAVPVVTQQHNVDMVSVLYPAQYVMQYPNINYPPYPVGRYQFPSVPGTYYPPPSTALVSPPQPPPIPEVVVGQQPAASASVSLPPSAQPDYKN